MSFISVIATMSQDQEGSNNPVKARFSWGLFCDFHFQPNIRLTITF